MTNLFDLRLTTRLCVGVLALALVAGAFVAGTQMNSSADEPEAAPSPRLTAYVDFMSLLKDDQLLVAKQFETMQDVQTQGDEIEAKYIELIRKEEENRRLAEPDTWQYLQSMQRLLDLQARRYEDQLLLEQKARKYIRDYGIKRYNELRNMVNGIATERGYNEVLNIVRNVEDVRRGEGDGFENLQQQLLVSPVLQYEEAHDITDIVSRAADEEWGTDLNMPGPITFTLEGEDEPLERNNDDVIEIRFGQTGTFHTDLADGGTVLSPDDENAGLLWTRAGIRVGELSEDGAYVAPDAWPPRDDEFIVTVRSAVDPTVNQNITVRLLNEEGQTRAEEEAAAGDEPDEGEADDGEGSVGDGEGE